MSENLAPSGLKGLKAGDRVAAALSGGVDSTVAARMLQELGLDVLAFHLMISRRQSAADQALEAARALGLELEVLDVSDEFERLIVEPFVKGYARGETPNPCTACNPTVKFGLLWEKARERGAVRIATGHYAALEPRPDGAGPALVRALDQAKDQTYFLCRLEKAMLDRAAFPLAGLTKAEVRRRALDLGLSPRVESQEVCFLAGEDYRGFIKDRLGEKALRPGDFVDARGRVLGRHQGLYSYTVGQRRGLGLPGPEPYYVLALDPGLNRVVIGTKKQTLARGFFARDMVWSVNPPGSSFQALVQVRSRHRPARARVRLLTETRIEVVFERPQSALTPGQAAAVYSDRTLLGGGWIGRAEGE